MKKNLFEYKEYKYYSVITDDEIMEMSNITSKTTGIKDVVIWLGPNPHYHGYRIKVSNIPNKFSREDCFTLTIPELNTIGKINNKLINKKKLEKIKEFVRINMKLIIDYSNEEIATDELIEKLRKID